MIHTNVSLKVLTKQWTMYRLKFLFLLQCILIKSAFSQVIPISLFYHENPDYVIVTIQNGKFAVYKENSVIDSLIQGSNISVFLKNENLKYQHEEVGFKTNKEFTLKGDEKASFFINYVGSNTPARCYEGSLKFRLNESRLLVGNYVDLDSYVAAVVETEGGYNSPKEFYKVQSILARTYALRNINRHANEGFSLCDGMHCQAYKFKATYPIIMEASQKTKNLVLVDEEFQLIDALYHSNSGGQTLNSGDVWLENLDYLKSVEDNYAQYGRNFFWEFRMPTKQWKKYLISKGISDISNLSNEELLILQPVRKAYFHIGNDSLKIADIRLDFGLRSSFFTMEYDENKIIFHGKGYGHGVGLSQESAIELAKNDYPHKKIIDFFFKNVHIVNINILSVFEVLKQKGEEEIPD